jgi:hypothetical protein
MTRNAVCKIARHGLVGAMLSFLVWGGAAVAQVKSVNAPENDPLSAATAERAAKAYDASKTAALNLAQVGWNDLAARTAYQPTIKQQGDRWILYVGHHGGRTLNPLTHTPEENGTSIVDVTDVRAPKLLFHIPGEKGREVPGRETGGAQMARVCGGGELPNADPSKFYLLRTYGESGQEIWDVTTPEKPSLVWGIDGFQSIAGTCSASRISTISRTRRSRARFARSACPNT